MENSMFGRKIITTFQCSKKEGLSANSLAPGFVTINYQHQHLQSLQNH